MKRYREEEGAASGPDKHQKCPREPPILPSEILAHIRSYVHDEGCINATRLVSKAWADPASRPHGYRERKSPLLTTLFYYYCRIGQFDPIGPIFYYHGTKWHNVFKAREEAIKSGGAASLRRLLECGIIDRKTACGGFAESINSGNIEAASLIRTLAPQKRLRRARFSPPDMATLEWLLADPVIECAFHCSDLWENAARLNSTAMCDVLIRDRVPQYPPYLMASSSPTFIHARLGIDGPSNRLVTFRLEDWMTQEAATAICPRLTGGMPSGWLTHALSKRWKNFLDIRLADNHIGLINTCIEQWASEEMACYVTERFGRCIHQPRLHTPDCRGMAAMDAFLRHGSHVIDPGTDRIATLVESKPLGLLEHLLHWQGKVAERVINDIASNLTPNTDQALVTYICDVLNIPISSTRTRGMLETTVIIAQAELRALNQ